MDSQLQRELQETLDMEIDAELEADANELDAALLDADPPISASASTHADPPSSMLDDPVPGQDNELPPLVPNLPDIEHSGFSASPGNSRPSSVPASSSRRASASPPPESGIPSIYRRKRTPSPASLRHAAISAPVGLSTFTTRIPRTYTVEAICALPHPVPTHALACSYDMTHLLTGSDDGYIRDYDIFSAVNGKTFLSAPQRHHAGVVEGLMKAGQIRSWWENPGYVDRKGFVGGQALYGMPPMDEDPGLSPVYSLLMHSDALWGLAGTDAGHINLFTVRHEPGRVMHVMKEHKSPVSAMSMDYGEKGFFSASWDGEAIQWDLNTGSTVRNFSAHNSQLTSIAVRPAYSGPYLDPTPAPVAYRRKEPTQSSARRLSGDTVTNKNTSGDNPQMYRFSQEDVNMTSPGNAHETSSLFGDDPQDETDAKNSVPSPSPDTKARQPGDDAKSEGSVADSLFGDEGDESEGVNPEPTPAPPQQISNQNPYISSPAGPPTQPPQGTSQYVTFPVSQPSADNPQVQGQQGYYSTQTFSVQMQPHQQQQQYQQPLPIQVPQHAKPQRGPPPPAPKNAPPLLDNSTYSRYSSDLLMTAFVDGQVVLWDRRVSSAGKGVGRLWMSEKTPPWCLSACWSHDGGQIYAGRRNGTVDVWDVRLMGKNNMTDTPRLLKTLRNPPSSGVVSCVVPFPDCRHIASASVDNIRLWNVADAPGEDSSMAKPRGAAPFKIIPGHHGGYISQMLVDPGARFMITASSNRGLHGDSTRTVFVHDVKLAF